MMVYPIKQIFLYQSQVGANKTSRWVANSFKEYRLREGVPDCSLATAAKQSPRVVATRMGPMHMEPQKWPNPVRKKRLHFKKRSGLESHSFETWCQHGPFLVESPLKSTPPLKNWININSCERCIGWLYISFTCEK